jgi:hypothetical protein
MKLLLDISNSGSETMFVILISFIAFLVGVLIVRWVFGIEKIVNALQKQNDYTMVAVRLLKKMLIQQGVSAEEVDSVIENGNKKRK